MWLKPLWQLFLETGKPLQTQASSQSSPVCDQRLAWGSKYEGNVLGVATTCRIVLSFYSALEQN
jgi:hypothetical protein